MSDSEIVCDVLVLLIRLCIHLLQRHVNHVNS